jgi:hypothetical protein
MSLHQRVHPQTSPYASNRRHGPGLDPPCQRTASEPGFFAGRRGLFAKRVQSPVLKRLVGIDGEVPYTKQSASREAFGRVAFCHIQSRVQRRPEPLPKNTLLEILIKRR